MNCRRAHAAAVAAPVAATAAARGRNQTQPRSTQAPTDSSDAAPFLSRSPNPSTQPELNERMRARVAEGLARPGAEPLDGLSRAARRRVIDDAVAAQL